ncbi:peptidase inhibitor family I36 protein [Kitasatospora sp. NPDC088391]|uniref:peptidase inhibitor family I36 protein n=1 Tax=Kitasatospora sp. NPDC088391 TaxID=3364074 RepID=UPI003820369C
MRIRIGRGPAKAAAVAALAVGIAAANAGSAYADEPTGVEACPRGVVCLYYNSPWYGWGSFEDWSPNQSVDLRRSTFAHWANGSGYGQTVYGNAAALVNHTDHWVYIAVINGGESGFPPGYADSLFQTANGDEYLST